MLGRARGRLGPVLAQGDAMALPVRSGSIANACSVWVLQAVDDPEKVVAEAARVVRSGGRYVVCLTQHAALGDAVGPILILEGQ